MHTEMIDRLERLKHPPMEGGMTSGSRDGSLQHFDLISVDILMDVACQRGEQEAWRAARSEHAAVVEELRVSLVGDTLTQVLSWLLPLYEDLEAALVAPISRDPERPDDEWTDNRAETLQEVIDAFRAALPAMARVAGQDALVPDSLGEGQVSLWRDVHPSDPEPVVDVEKVPVGGLSVAELEAVYFHDTAAFADAGRVIVPEAIDELRFRAEDPHDQYQGEVMQAARDALRRIDAAAKPKPGDDDDAAGPDIEQRGEAGAEDGTPLPPASTGRLRSFLGR